MPLWSSALRMRLLLVLAVPCSGTQKNAFTAIHSWAVDSHQHQPRSWSSELLEATDLRRLSQPVPEVRHYKVSGSGYTRHSPLYARQAIWGGDGGAQGTAAAAPRAPARVERLGVAEPHVVSVTREVPPVSITVQCITNLTCQFFAVYTVLFLLQTSTRLGVTALQREERSFSAVVETVHFVPMLCVLFMATRMRAVQLTHGKPELYELPQWWVSLAMQVCTWSMLALTVSVLVLAHVHVEGMDAKGKRPAAAVTVLRYLRDLIMVAVYLSFTVICIGACVMQVPPQLADDPPRENAALACTLCLVVLYFGVCLARAAATFANRTGLLGQARRFGNAQEVLRNATTTVAFAPMLTVLFIAARIRTLQDGGGHGLPLWVIACFYICTLSVVLQTVCVVVIFALVPDDGVPTTQDNSARGAARRRSIARAVEYFRLFAMVVLYICVIAITVAALVFPRYSMMSAELDCVAVLAVLYFGVYLTQWAVQCARRDGGSPDEDGGRSFTALMEDCLHTAKVQVQFCPMFCVLFLASLLRALQVTDGHGAPQAWCQIVERIATAAIVGLTLICLEKLMPEAKPVVTRTFGALQYLCVGVLYASAIACLLALYTMSPESAAPGHGRPRPLTVLLSLGEKAWIRAAS